MTTVKTHLMFQGDAEQALELYASVFKEFKVSKMERYDEGDMAAAGQSMLARASFAGHELLIFDSPPIHKFGFTPAFSLFVIFESEAELETAFAKMAEGGKIMMPLQKYDFSPLYGWVEDRFGVSWQLGLPAE